MRLLDCLEVSASANEDELLNRLVRVVNELDFGRVSTALRFSDTLGRKISSSFFANTPQALIEKSMSPEDAARDPTFQTHLKSSLPFTYDQSTYVDGGAGDLWEAMAPFGYRTGINVTLHLPQNTHFLLSVDRDDDLPSDDGQLTQMMANCQLLAVHAHVAASRIVAARTNPMSLPRLTSREKEVLQWAMGNKSAWSTGQILGLSENTVKFHMKNAMRKLDAGSRHQALSRAVSLGILEGS